MPYTSVYPNLQTAKSLGFCLHTPGLEADKPRRFSRAAALKPVGRHLRLPKLQPLGLAEPQTSGPLSVSLVVVVVLLLYCDY